ncbi:uncharacterized protein LOC125036971 [Penaeus chinensis]|uniref:uncharacterized protein LOC125036971 n=1 Tax=Penaeus chinensis TaxID=139456 RepID=UPI001FB5B714|nr:uncharacterized protein LOC125036971 [Penaeus chinensis]
MAVTERAHNDHNILVRGHGMKEIYRSWCRVHLNREITLQTKKETVATKKLNASVSLLKPALSSLDFISWNTKLDLQSKLQPTFESAQSLLNIHILYFQAISVNKMKVLAIAITLCLAVLYTQALPAEMPSSPLLLSRAARSPRFHPRDCVPCNCKTKITHITILEHEVRPTAARFGGHGGGRPCCPCPGVPF